MYKSIILFAVSCLVLEQSQAQNLYMPRDIQLAYKKGTRSMDGKPGPNYWENHGRYNISISVEPPGHTIKGHELITYYNNSPDTLRRLNMKLIMNIHRAGGARLDGVGDDYLTPGMQIDNFEVNGEKKDWDNKMASATNEMLGLSKAVMPHDSVQLDITWHFEIARGHGREGIIDSTTYYLAYFYPRVSVYDDYNGWDRLPFLDAQEFYNDFNDYTLNVTVPKNFMVWATGTLQNPGQVLQPEYAKRLQQSMTSDSTVHIATQQDIEKKNITAQNETNTWTWKASNVSDMAVGISDRYDWDAASAIVDDATGRRASMQSAFDDKSADFHHAVQAGRHSLSWLSNNWPGVSYPFPKMTSFQGFADMEYPMMVNDSHQTDIPLFQLIQGEERISHTYFPFYMGVNETRYAFMDEGWATTFELLIGTTEIGKQQMDKIFKQFRINGWIHDPSTAEDIPIITPSSEINEAYGNNSYGKPALSHLALKDMLGDELFKKALHTYMDNWNGKHPIPWDYFNSMSTGSGKNLNWFFYNWFFTNGYIDLDLQDVKKDDSGYLVSIKNIGGFAVPFDILITYTDGTTKSLHVNPAIWEKAQKQTNVHIITDKTIQTAVLDGGIFMDADESNNKWTMH